MGEPYEDIADMMGVTVDTVVSHYRHAKERMLEALKFADNRHATMERCKSMLKRNENATGKLTKGQRWLVMNKLFGLTPAEIGTLDDATPQRVSHSIKAVHDRIITGNEIFLNPTTEQIEKSRQRIEAKRARDRKTNNNYETISANTLLQWPVSKFSDSAFFAKL